MSFILQLEQRFTDDTRELVARDSELTQEIYAKEQLFQNKADTVQHLMGRFNSILTQPEFTSVDQVNDLSIERKEEQVVQERTTLDNLSMQHSHELNTLQQQHTQDVKELRQKYKQKLTQLECHSISVASPSTTIDNEIARVQDEITKIKQELAQQVQEYQTLVKENDQLLTIDVSCAVNGDCDEKREKLSQLADKRMNTSTKLQTLKRLFDDLQVKKKAVNEKVYDKLKECQREHQFVIDAMNEEHSKLAYSYRNTVQDNINNYEEKRVKILERVKHLEADIQELHDTNHVSTHYTDLSQLRRELLNAQEEEVELHSQLVELARERETVRQEYADIVAQFLHAERVWHNIHHNHNLASLMRRSQKWQTTVKILCNILNDTLSTLLEQPTSRQQELVQRAIDEIDKVTSEVSKLHSDIVDMGTVNIEKCKAAYGSNLVDDAVEFCQSTVERVTTELNELTSSTATLAEARVVLRDIDSLMQSIVTAPDKQRVVDSVADAVERLSF